MDRPVGHHLGGAAPAARRVAGRKLGGLDEADRFHLVALTRDGVTVLALPDLVGQEGDTLFLSVRKDPVEELSTRLHGTDAAGGHH